MQRITSSGRALPQHLSIAVARMALGALLAALVLAFFPSTAHAQASTFFGIDSFTLATQTGVGSTTPEPAILALLAIMALPLGRCCRWTEPTALTEPAGSPE